MIKKFKPCLSILPPKQKCLWPQLGELKRLGFVLYGGTAIALRLGHRESVDFDFFSEKPLDREAIKTSFPLIEEAISIQDQGNTWVLLTPVQDGSKESSTVKVAFFGAISFGRISDPELTEDGMLLVASLDDLMATKTKTVLQRAEAKDYRDVVSMLEAGVSLPHGLAAARLMFGTNFQPSESLKALSYFKDGDLHMLTAQEKTILVAAVSKIRKLPKVTLRSKSLSN